VGVGAVLRNQIAGIVALLLMLFVIDPTFSALFEGYAPYSIGGLGTAISGGSGGDVAGGADLLSGLDRRRALRGLHAGADRSGHRAHPPPRHHLIPLSAPTTPNTSPSP
jgi:hypothetical protein